MFLGLPSVQILYMWEWLFWLFLLHYWFVLYKYTFKDSHIWLIINPSEYGERLLEKYAFKRISRSIWLSLLHIDSVFETKLNLWPAGQRNYWPSSVFQISFFSLYTVVMTCYFIQKVMQDMSCWFTEKPKSVCSFAYMASINIVWEHPDTAVITPKTELNYPQLFVGFYGKTRNMRFTFFPCMATFPADLLPMQFYRMCHTNSPEPQLKNSP